MTDAQKIRVEYLVGLGYVTRGPAKTRRTVRVVVPLVARKGGT